MQPSNTTPVLGGTWGVIAGFILSVAVLVITFLDPSFISHGLAVLFLGIISLAATTFHLNVVGVLNQTIQSLTATVGSLSGKLAAIAAGASQQNSSETTTQ